MVAVGGDTEVGGRDRILCEKGKLWKASERLVKRGENHLSVIFPGSFSLNPTENVISTLLLPLPPSFWVSKTPPLLLTLKQPMSSTQISREGASAGLFLPWGGNGQAQAGGPGKSSGTGQGRWKGPGAGIVFSFTSMQVEMEGSESKIIKCSTTSSVRLLLWNGNQSFISGTEQQALK